MVAVLVCICFRNHAIHKIDMHLSVKPGFVRDNRFSAPKDVRCRVTRADDARKVSGGGIREVGRGRNASIDLSHGVLDENSAVICVLRSIARGLVLPA